MELKKTAFDIHFYCLLLRNTNERNKARRSTSLDKISLRSYSSK